MTRILNTLAAMFVACVLAVTGAAPIDMNTLRYTFTHRPAFIAIPR